jgi:hypothetical protein
VEKYETYKFYDKEEFIDPNSVDMDKIKKENKEK